MTDAERIAEPSGRKGGANVMTLTDWLAAADRDPDPASVLLIAADDLEEQGLDAEASYLRQEEFMISPPFAVGESWLICTVTLYYVGRVVEKGAGWVKLEDASWVHWTGRLSTLLKVKDFTKVEGRTPRTEFCGQVVVATQAIVSAYPWTGPLPVENVQ